MRPGFQISNFGYDDNIMRNRGTQDRIGDYTATMTAKLDGLLLFGDRAFLTLRETYDYNLYFDHSDQNHDNLRSLARLTVPFEKFGFFADMTWVNVEERPVDLEDERPERREQRYGFGMIVPAPRHWPQVRATVRMPCWNRTCPCPPQVEHRSAVEPGSARSP